MTTKRKQKRIQLSFDPLVADLRALIHMLEEEQSKPERRKLCIELAERVYEIVERSAQLSTKPAREAKRAENPVKEKIFARARELYAEDRTRTANKLADIICAERKSKTPTHRTIWNWIKDANIVGNL